MELAAILKELIVVIVFLSQAWEHYESHLLCTLTEVREDDWHLTVHTCPLTHVMLIKVAVKQSQTFFIYFFELDQFAHGSSLAAACSLLALPVAISH